MLNKKAHPASTISFEGVTIGLAIIILAMIGVAIYLFVRFLINFKNDLKTAVWSIGLSAVVSLWFTGAYFVLSWFFVVLCLQGKGTYLAPPSYIPFVIAVVFFVAYRVYTHIITKQCDDEFVLFKKASLGVRTFFAVLVIVAFEFACVAIVENGYYSEILICMIVAGIGAVSICLYSYFLAKKQKEAEAVNQVGQDVVTDDVVDSSVEGDLEGVVEEVVEEEVVPEPTLAQKIQAVFDEQKPKHESDFVEYDNVNLLCQAFVDFAKENKVDVDFDFACRLFAGLASCRCVWLQSKSVEYTNKVVQLLKLFLGCGKNVYHLTKQMTAEQLVELYCENGDQKEYFAQELCVAKVQKRAMQICAFDANESSDFDVVLNLFENYLKAVDFGDNFDLSGVEGANLIPQLDKGVLALPSNLWFVFVLPSNQKQLPSSQEYAVSIKVDQKVACDNIDDNVEAKPISAKVFDEIAKRVVEKYFVSLDVWKKFDKLTEYLSSVSNFGLTNPIECQTEMLSAMLVCCGADEVEAIDYIIANKIIPVFANCTQTKDSEIALFEQLDRIFGIENLPLSHKALIDFGFDK